MLDALGFRIEVFRGVQPSFPNCWITGTFGKVAIPARKFTQLLRRMIIRYRGNLSDAMRDPGELSGCCRRFAREQLL